MSLEWTEAALRPVVELECLREGMGLVFLWPSNGWQADQEHAARHLEVGRFYTLERFEVHSWHTDVWLREIPGERFNSVHFSEAES